MNTKPVQISPLRIVEVQGVGNYGFPPGEHRYENRTKHTHTHTHARARARLTMFIVTPALARCDIGVRFSVRPSVFPSTIYVDPSI